MIYPRKTIRRAAFTLVEASVIVAIVALLVAILLPPLAVARFKAKRIQCTSHMKQMGLSFRLFATDHADSFPAMISTNRGGAAEYVPTASVFRQFLSMSNELSTPQVLACPADFRKPSKSFMTLTDSNVSYFVNVDATETRPQELLSGDRNLEFDGMAVTSGMRELRTNSVVGFSREIHRGAGDILLADGSAQQVNRAALQLRVVSGGATTNRLLIP